MRKKKGQYVKIRKGNKQFRKRMLKNNQKERPHMRGLTYLKKQQKKKVSKGRNNSKERERVDRFHSFTFVRMVLFCPPLLEKKNLYSTLWSSFYHHQ